MESSPEETPLTQETPQPLTLNEIIRKRIDSEPDYIPIKRFDYSLTKLLEKYPDGNVPDRLIAQALLISEEEIEETYQKIVIKLRHALNIKLEE
jgi:hypothetical protein